MKTIELTDAEFELLKVCLLDLSEFYEGQDCNEMELKVFPGLVELVHGLEKELYGDDFEDIKSEPDEDGIITVLDSLLLDHIIEKIGD